MAEKRAVCIPTSNKPNHKVMGTEVVHAYRHLYRCLLRAVQYSSPARYIARDQLRAAFRETPALDAEGVKRTIWFLEAAGKERGLEHAILKNLLRVRGQRDAESRSWKKNLIGTAQRTMGLCLR
ncbi:hypothetical protein MAC_03657 [Metarhizium acridum CQMa 102]|uniref:Uncharacterized protein n=1 Tax=Metarhizium acridum (strain CQMa 102) TaxID=655827 RepID=E9E1A9_METAQ|nr:uncharacterized protein MAC_03657 [Metarhizium acridum CQMa 102]EFY90411.1 hypothetical protein MAC_03657 [Metarhizium acridum CQMa 102]